jgi:hypothetical protein
LAWYQQRLAAADSAKKKLLQQQHRANHPNEAKRSRVAVDKVFLKRLFGLVKVLVPHALSREVFQLLALTALLMGRTILTLKIADMSTLYIFGDLPFCTVD